MSSRERPRLFGPWRGRLGITLIEPEPGYDKRSFEWLLCESAEDRADEIACTLALADAVRGTILRQMRGQRPLLGSRAVPDTAAESNRTWLSFGRIAKLKQKYTRLTAIAAQGLDAL